MKTNCAYIIVFFLCNFLSINVFGVTPYPQIIPPSSDAAALGKYGQYPVALYNGLVQIEIPVHSIQLPLFNLPVSLSYHASGIKVDEIPTPVGLGWVLNAGGVITRTVKGLPDQNFGASGLIRDKQWVLNSFPTNSDNKIDYLYTIYNNEKTNAFDTETDAFYYNFCGFSGSFRYDINGNLIQVPLTNNLIEYDSGTKVFKITGSDGTIYGFSDKETGQYNVNGGWVPYISSWYLSWIKTTDNRLIDFEYMEDNTSYTEHVPNYWLKIDHTPPDWSGLMSETPYFPTNNTLLIKTITFPEGSIIFDYTGDRADRRKYRLTGIRIKDKIAAGSVKSFALEHSYFTPTGVANATSTGGYSSHHDYRLKLDKLVLRDNGNNPVGNYQFDYNVSKLLPAYFNYPAFSPGNSSPYYGQDAWGYYNGVTTNKNLFIYEQQQNYSMPLSQANRSVNADFAQACILKKITYPTKGYTEFEYEGNKFSNGENAGGLRIKSVKSYTLQTSDPVVKSYQYGGGIGNITGWRRVQGASYTQAEIVKNLSVFWDELKFFDYYFSLPNLPLSHSGGASVFYGNVTEFDGTVENSNGKTDYYFLYSSNDVEYVLPDQYPSVLPNLSKFLGFGAAPNRQFIPRFDYQYIDRGWTRGYTNSIKVYKKINGLFSLVKHTVYDYTTFQKQKNVVGFKSFANFNTSTKAFAHQGMYWCVLFDNANDGFQYTDISMETGIVKLTEVRDTSYLDNTKVTQVTKHFYNNLNKQYEVTATYQTNSNGTTSKRWFKYPNDLAVAPYTSMVNRNMLSQVIVTTDSVDNKFIQESETVYTSLSGPFTNPLIIPSNTTVRRGTSAKETDFTFHNYDIYGNIQYLSKYTADPVVYLWGYNYQYPVAEIKGATFSDVTIYISSSTLNTIAAKNEPSSSDWDLINGLRSSLPKALVTTFTYQPLVGMRTMTDPRNVVTQYDYDPFGRLKKVTRAGRVVDEYTYNYRN